MLLYENGCQYNRLLGQTYRLQEMTASGLVDDSTLESPEIIDIPLRDLCAMVDLEQGRAHASLAKSSGDRSVDTATVHSANDIQELEGDANGDRRNNVEYINDSGQTKYLLNGPIAKHQACIRVGSYPDILDKICNSHSVSFTTSQNTSHSRSMSTGAAETETIDKLETKALVLMNAGSSMDQHCSIPAQSRYSSSSSTSAHDSIACEDGLHCHRMHNIASSGNVDNFSTSHGLSNVGSLNFIESNLDRRLAPNHISPRISPNSFGVPSNSTENSSKSRPHVSSRLVGETLSNYLHDDESEIDLKTVTKEQILYQWKMSEIDLAEKLREANREKASLEKKLALMQNQSLV